MQSKYQQVSVPAIVSLTRRDLKFWYLRQDELQLSMVIFEHAQGELLDLTRVPSNTAIKAWVTTCISLFLKPKHEYICIFVVNNYNVNLLNSKQYCNYTYCERLLLFSLHLHNVGYVCICLMFFNTSLPIFALIILLSDTKYKIFFILTLWINWK